MLYDSEMTFKTDEGGEVHAEDLPNLVQELRNEVLAEAEPEAKRTYPASVLRELRQIDRKNIEKTCSVCYVRQPIAKMGSGKAEICDDCQATL